jgi:hypothetical protein
MHPVGRMTALDLTWVRAVPLPNACLPVGKGRGILGEGDFSNGW